ncbi:hypothetical protein NPIL_51571 [Nephila pilipes]|uniref:Uncharacterized protein n=1 Tax=Nephila pilipes TaxID=299642 RepID=A0A8X6PXA2_NEPPI|nr:hypothetical protein NPIL_51571 [Nephila pilipes]
MRENLLASAALASDMYMNNLLTDSDDLATATELQRELIVLLSRGVLSMTSVLRINLLTFAYHDFCDPSSPELTQVGLSRVYDIL